MILNNIQDFEVIRIHKRHSYELLEKEFIVYLSKPLHASNSNVKLWRACYEDLKVIFTNYFTVSDETKCEGLELENFPVAFHSINEKYRKEPLINVTQLSIVKAYPQRINDLITNDLKSTDGYFPFIFRIIYNISTATLIRNFFLNYTYAYFVFNKWNIKINKNLSEDVVKFYADIFRAIPEELYYYSDTDMLFFPKENTDKIKAYFDYENIKYEIEDSFKLRFFQMKTYYSINKHEEIKHGKMSDNLTDSTKALFKRIELHNKLKKIKCEII